MRIGKTAVLVGLPLALAACQPPPPAVNVPVGWKVLQEDRMHGQRSCDGRPVLILGTESDFYLTGNCPQVRVASTHSDVDITIQPRGRIEITGSHNDVTWRLARPGPPPELVNAGVSNDFHKGRKASTDED